MNHSWFPFRPKPGFIPTHSLPIAVFRRACARYMVAAKKTYPTLVKAGELKDRSRVERVGGFFFVAVVLRFGGSKNRKFQNGLNPAKRKHGPHPAVCPSDRLILSHSHLTVDRIPNFVGDW